MGISFFFIFLLSDFFTLCNVSRRCPRLCVIKTRSENNGNRWDKKKTLAHTDGKSVISILWTLFTGGNEKENGKKNFYTKNCVFLLTDSDSIMTGDATETTWVCSTNYFLIYFKYGVTFFRLYFFFRLSAAQSKRYSFVGSHLKCVTKLRWKKTNFFKNTHARTLMEVVRYNIWIDKRSAQILVYELTYFSTWHYVSLRLLSLPNKKYTFENWMVTVYVTNIHTFCWCELS